jgi:hypothetical protein
MPQLLLTCNSITKHESPPCPPHILHTTYTTQVAFSGFAENYGKLQSAAINTYMCVNIVSSIRNF